MNGASNFQNSSLTLLKNKTAPATWYLRFYEERDGRRVYRNQRIGTIRGLRTRRDAEKAVLNLRVKVNSEIRSPETVSELINHYKKHELSEAGNKRSSTRRGYKTFLGLYVEPRWGALRLDNVKTVQVEQWLRLLIYSPATKSKIRNVMSAVFAHAKRYEFISTNPILGVRCSAKRLREPDILTPDEFNRLVNELPLLGAFPKSPPRLSHQNNKASLMTTDLLLGCNRSVGRHWERRRRRFLKFVVAVY